MAYMDQEKKKRIKAELDRRLKEKGLIGKAKVTLSVNRHSSIVATIKKGSIDFISNYNEIGENDSSRNANWPFQPAKDDIDVNVYHYEKHFSGEALEFLTEVVEALNLENFDKSDIMSDYFHVGHYVDVKVGRWNKPYILEDA